MDGTGNYIFISYRRADWERVGPVLAEMEKQGYRIWYDKKGIHAGEQWPDALAKEIAGCAFVIPFLSGNFYQSDHCLQEIRHARRNKRPFFPVRLDREDVPQNFQFLLEDYQGERLSEEDTPETFAARLEEHALFQSCRKRTPAPAQAPLLRAEIVTRSRPSAPSAAFTGREDRIQELETALQTEPAVVLCGMGGLGKSEICRKLFDNYTQTGTALCKKTGWLMWNESLQNTVYQQFEGINEENAERYLQMVKNFLETEGRDLLLFLDNADDMTEQDAADLTALGCRFLITSRREFEHAYTVEVGRLTPEQCRVLYRRAAKEKERRDDASPDETLNEILRLAGYHTLTVTLLAKTRNAEGLSDRELLDKLKDFGFDLSEGKISYLHTPEKKSGDDENQTFIDHMSRVFNLFTIRHNGATLMVLQGMSLLAPHTSIPKRTAQKWLSLEDSPITFPLLRIFWLLTKKWRMRKILNGLNSAVKGGWLEERTENGVPCVSIHPVIAAVIWHNDMPKKFFVDAVAGELYRDIVWEDEEVFTKKLPIALHAIALDRVAQRLFLCTQNYACMLYWIGYFTHMQGDYLAALEWYHKARIICEKNLGKEHADTAAVYNNIGLVYEAMGDYPTALEWHHKALNIREKIFGKEHPYTAISYNNIGMVYNAKGDYPAALEWYHKALNNQKNALWKEHPRTATTYNNIGGVYNEMGDYYAALEWYHKALNIREKVLREGHPDTATSYNNIGFVCDDIGDYVAALEWYHKALDIREKVLGKEHPDTAQSYNNIGVLYSEQGNYAEALCWLEKALEIRQKKLGPEHPLTQDTQKWLTAAKNALSKSNKNAPL